MDDRLELTPEFPYNWMYDATMPENAVFTISIHCKALVLIFKDSGEVEVEKKRLNDYHANVYKVVSDR